MRVGDDKCRARIGLGLAQGGLGVEQVDHAVEALAETRLTHGERFAGRRQRSVGGRLAGAGGGEVVPGLPHFEGDPLLEAADIARE